MKGRLWLALASLVLANAHASCLPLIIAVPVQQTGIATTQSWVTLCRRVQVDTGIDLRSLVLKDHRAVIEALRGRFVDLAVVDPAWYVNEKPSLAPLLQARDVRQNAASVCLIVPKSSIFYKPSDLAGRSIALTRAGQSAAGYFVPLALLAAAGVVYPDPRQLIFAETFDSILKGVAFEKLDAGVVPSYDLETGKGLAYADFIRVIATSAPLPQSMIVIRSTDEPARFAAIVRAFLGLSATEAGRQALLQSGYADFALPDAAGYEALERYLRTYRDAYGAPD